MELGHVNWSLEKMAQCVFACLWAFVFDFFISLFLDLHICMPAYSHMSECLGLCLFSHMPEFVDMYLYICICL